MSDFEKFAFNNFLIYGKNLVRIEDVERFYNEYCTTKRALWLARAERACERLELLHVAMNNVDGLTNEEFDKMNINYTKWQCVERKCRLKAEEYR